MGVQTPLQKGGWIHKTQEGTENLSWPFLQKQSKDRFGLEGDEESTMLEESVSPKKYVEEGWVGFPPGGLESP